MKVNELVKALLEIGNKELTVHVFNEGGEEVPAAIKLYFPEDPSIPTPFITLEPAHWHEEEK